ncbi:MAG TPA: peptidylprolyl isomerase, partial [Candidatus Limnocylindrales bacterium]|nr:peptidylprolyl isomerase [Candidatus Limnocylindrales bacterium]
MTLRAKPVVKGPGRSGWNSEARRTFLTNLGFVLVIVLSVVLLVGYAAYSYYDDHFGAVATVDGTTVTRDQLVARVAIEDFRIKYTESRIRTLLAAGRLTEASASEQLQFLDQRRQSLGSIALERLIDIELQAKLAAEAGVTVSEADIDARLLSEATIDEQRHAWVIEVTPDNDPLTGTPGDAETAAARATAEAALAELKGGKAWEDVANSVSEAASAVQAGDLGWLPLDSGYDEPFMTAIFAAEPDQPTEVVVGDDGVFRVGRITEVAPASVDETFQSRLDDAEIKLADYRAAIKGDLIRTGLDEKIVADLSQPSAQRHVQQIFLSVNTPQPEGVKVRHILVSPKDDPGAAQDLPAEDPAWKAAEDEAASLYDLIVADPRRFDALAREKSDEGQAISSGGKLPYYDPTSPIDNDFAKAIFAPGLKPGQLLPPFKSSFGWHIVQFMRPYGDGEAAWLT